MIGIQKNDVKNMGEKIDLFDSDSSVEDEEYLSDSELDSFENYVESMDEELRSSKVGPSLPDGPEAEDIKVNKNLLQNLLDSFSAQEGLPGPVSNIMLSLNTPLPKK